MEEFAYVRFKQSAVIGGLTAEKVPPIGIHRRVQVVYCDQCVKVKSAVRKLFQKQNSIFFKGRISKILQRWRKFIEVLMIL
jgi:hypothetical protein